MKRFPDRPTLLLLLTDAAIVLGGVPIAHQIVTGSWGESFSAAPFALFVTAVYLLSAASGGRYRNPSAEARVDALLQTGGRLLGAGLFVLLAGSLLTSQHTLSPSILVVHGLLTLIGLVGRLLLWVDQPPRAPSSSSAPSSRPSDLEVQLGDLIPRSPLQINRSALRNYLSARTVLVTGAGGSIGQELSFQLADLDAARLVLVDMSEQNLHQLETSLRTAAPETELSFHLADVRDDRRMASLLTQERPDVVVHTAAYKHVHLMERHPIEAFQNNTRSTAQLLRLCEDTGVDQFLFVSTDKAVYPANVLGATKQRAEWYVRTAQPGLQAKTVRFGNIFGSTGSVVPRFLNRLEQDEPLPITHPDMERYFMTAPEACQLLLQLLLLEAYPTYILKMGDPVRIQWLAEQLIERWSPETDPSKQIEYVGPRPGEKLSEELTYENESIHQTRHTGILGLESAAPYSRDTLDRHFEHVASLCDSPKGTPETVKRLLLQSEPAAPASVT